MAQCGKNSKATDEGKQNIREANNSSVEEGRLASRTMGPYKVLERVSAVVDSTKIKTCVLTIGRHCSEGNRQ